MLQLAGGVALGMQIGNLFELQGPLESDGIVDAPTDVHEVAMAGILPGQRLDRFSAIEHLLH